MHVIGTAGHVDHGKSALVERLTGIDPDRFAEEKRRGLTIDLGFAWLALPSGNEVGIIDVPGHEKFIKNMLAGAGGTTICLFVVAANEGWRQQSAEHLAILDILGVTEGIVALTKIDLVDEETRSLAAQEIEDRLKPSSLKGIRVIPCSSVTGEGIDEFVSALDKIVAAATPAPDLARPRLWVDRVFTIAGAGTVVTGTLGGGSLAVGDEVEITPEGRTARIRAIQSHKKELDRIGPGNRTALNLAGLERQGAQRGDAIVRRKQWHPTRRVHARVRVLDPSIAGQSHELSERGAHLLYAGTAETPVKVKLIDAVRIPPGEAGYAELHLRDPLPIARGDRFVLRDAGRVLTFGGGEILDSSPEEARRDGSLRERLEQMTGVDAADALHQLVETEGAIPIDQALTRTGAGEVPPGPTRLGPLLVSPAFLKERQDAMTATLGDFHQQRPLEKGMRREDARRAVMADHPDAFDDLIACTDETVDEGATIRLAIHEVVLDQTQAAARAKLLEQLEANGFNPPLAKELDTDPDLLRSLAASGEIVKIGDFYLTANQAREARSKVRSSIESDGPVTVAAIRDLLQTSRKYAVPLCEWLDQTGATRRQGDVRVLGPHP